jgi:hypothetical protein
VVSVTTRPRFSPRERTPGTHCTGDWVGLRAGLDTQGTGKIFSPLPWIEPRSPGRPACSQTLHWLSYPAHCLWYRNLITFMCFLLMAFCCVLYRYLGMWLFTQIILVFSALLSDHYVFRPFRVFFRWYNVWLFCHVRLVVYRCWCVDINWWRLLENVHFKCSYPAPVLCAHVNTLCYPVL